MLFRPTPTSTIWLTLNSLLHFDFDFIGSYSVCCIYQQPRSKTKMDQILKTFHCFTLTVTSAESRDDRDGYRMTHCTALLSRRTRAIGSLSGKSNIHYCVILQQDYLNGLLTKLNAKCTI